jgi:tail tube protein
MALNRKIALVGIDRQVSGKGTLAATALYGMGLRGGMLFNPQMEQTYEELTIADRFPPSAYRTSFHPGADFTSRAWPRSIGLLLYASLGSISTVGSADPWTHTITPGATPLYLTLFSRLDTEYHKLRDCRIDELSFTWDRAEPLEISCSVLGTIPSLYQGSWSATTDDSAEQSFFPAGGIFQLDSDSVTPVTADITGGSITIANHLEPIDLSRALTPDDNWPGLHEITVTLRLIPADTTLLRSIWTASDSGTAVSNAPVYGSFNTKFTISASRDLTFTATRLAWTGDYPEADPAGGPAEIELTATVLKPAGTAFTATLLNQVASYPGS